MQSDATTTNEYRRGRLALMKRILPLVLWLLCLVLWMGALVFEQPVNAYLYPNLQFSPIHLAINIISQFLFIQGLATIGVLVILRADNQRYGWLMLAAAFTFILDRFTQFYGVYALLVVPEADLPLGKLAAWVQNLWFINLSLFYIYMPLFFPNGKLPSPQWRPIFRLITIYLTLVVLGIAFIDAPLSNLFLDAEIPVRNPFGIIQTEFFPEPLGNVGFILLFLLFALSLLAAIASLVFRWRKAGNEVRQQIKWVLFILGLLTGLRVIDWIAGGVFTGFIDTELAITFERYVRYAQQLAAVGLVVALGFALLKYRLFDIDIIINRTLVYGVVSLTLILVYFISVVLLQSLFAWVTNQQSPFAIVVSTLLIAALFNPLRRHVQEFIDRRFYRRNYDRVQTLARFAATARDEVDIDLLKAELVSVVSETMQPESVSIWIKPAGNSPLNWEKTTS